MYTILATLTVIAFLAVLGTLVMGAVSMGGKQAKDRDRSNLWMRRRVLLQALAIILLFLTFYVKRQSGV